MQKRVTQYDIESVYEYIKSSKGKISEYKIFHDTVLFKDEIEQIVPVIESRKVHNCHVSICCDLLKKFYEITNQNNAVFIIICDNPLDYRELFATVSKAGFSIFFVSRNTNMKDITVTPEQIKHKAKLLCTCCNKYITSHIFVGIEYLKQRPICNECLQLTETSIFRTMCKQKNTIKS